MVCLELFNDVCRTSVEVMIMTNRKKEKEMTIVFHCGLLFCCVDVIGLELLFDIMILVEESDIISLLFDAILLSVVVVVVVVVMDNDVKVE